MAAPLESRVALEALRKQIEKDTGSKLVWGNDEDLRPAILPTGLHAVDEALCGGFAFNRLALIVGEEQAGKTLLAMQAMKAAQALGLPTVFVDIERTWTNEWAEHVGLNAADVIVSLPPNGEKAFDVARAIIQTKPAGVIVLDSIAAMPPAKELEVESEQGLVGTQARMVNRGLRALNAENTGGWCIIMINQIRMKVGVMYGSPETLPGGVGQSYYAWQIIRVRKGARIEEGTGDSKVLVGRTLKLRVDKNKQGPPNRTAEVPFYFTGQFDLVSGLIDKAIDVGVLVGSGGYYTFGEFRWHGRKAVREAFNESEALTEALKAEIAAVEALPDVADL